MKATPKPDMGMPNTEPSTPIPSPAPSTTALRPPASPARIASAAATPGGHGPCAGNTSEANMRYSIVASSSMAATAPISIVGTRSARPSRNGTPIGSSRLLAAPKVEAEIALWARFCTWIER